MSTDTNRAIEKFHFSILYPIFSIRKVSALFPSPLGTSYFLMLQAERYGIRLPNIRNLRLDGDYREIMENGEVRYEFDDGFSVSVNDGICIYSAPDQEPDYKVVAVYPYGHLVLEVERRFEGGI